MALSNKFLSPTCAPAHWDIATYFFSKKIDPIPEYVFQWHNHPNGPKPQKWRHLNAYFSIGSKYFSEKKVWGDIFMSRRTCWWKDFFVKCHPTELSAKCRGFVRNYFLVPFGGYVTEKHILVSDRNIFSKKKYAAVSLWAGGHVSERNLLLSAIRRSYR